MRRQFLFISFLFSLFTSFSFAQPADTVSTTVLNEAAVFSHPKEIGTMLQQATAYSSVTQGTLTQQHVGSVKDLGTLVPNLFMPNYGSRQTSAVYIRGIGSRINTPAVGLYVDNVPWYDKSAFDFPFYDIESIEVLRGPQSTLYGRNTMAGVVRVNTRSPFRYQGTDIHIGLAAPNWQRQVSATHYHRVNSHLAFSGGGYYDGQEGFFRHDITDRPIDRENAGGARLRALYRSDKGLRLDGNISFDYTNAGAYPYYYKGALDASKEQYPDLTELITPNLEGRYRRALLNAGLNLELVRPLWTFNAVTALQHLGDRMFMDQDFIQADIYSLEQRQHITTISEELTLKLRPTEWWQGLTGANFYYQANHTTAPVTFRPDGIAWLNGLINAQGNANMPLVQQGPMTMAFNFADNIDGSALLFDNDFHTPTTGLALFHQSTFTLGQFNILAGFRLDYERNAFRYDAGYDFSHTYALSGHLTMPTMERDIAMIPATVFPISRHLSDKASTSTFQFLPRLALRYDLPTGNLYASVARGFRSGGYNIQNVSDLLQAQMQADMMKDICDATFAVPQAVQYMPAEARETLLAMAAGGAGDVSAACRYKPEHAWNYELGSHLRFWQNRLTADVSAFWSEVSDLQLSQMTTGGLGRITVNAGRSRNIGAELSLRLRPIDHLNLDANYGYTHAKLTSSSLSPSELPAALRHPSPAREGENTLAALAMSTSSEPSPLGKTEGTVPFVPAHTFNLDASYFIPHSRTTGVFSPSLAGEGWRSAAGSSDGERLGVSRGFLIGLSLSGAGPIYWTESNSVKQPFYLLLGARVSYRLPHFDITLWGRNLTNTAYDAFYFESMSRGYAQKGHPLQVGLDFRIRI